MAFFSLVALAIFGSFLPDLAAGDNWQPNFNETCSDIWWEQSGLAPHAVTLFATCELSGGTTTSSLDLGVCLTVGDNGQISGMDNGNWGGHADCGCGEYDVAQDGSTLSCTCTNSKGDNNYFNEFNLNQVVGNTAGFLYCYSTLGTVAN
ncbi:hypothetical protein N0V93_007938 [Gnomoniopsis smithogilvyi]|uniref:Cyanovirin-N domain-containing protein n=1 Tax=Gnomoniopsis smithogilvyi TaxID=1191159 RepID=A0A9W9CUA6_9PEZI|nr:hypothetical protein N0V93_007938 [Gnomoniopsis smithogilvyi]